MILSGIELGGAKLAISNHHWFSITYYLLMLMLMLMLEWVRGIQIEFAEPDSGLFAVVMGKHSGMFTGFAVRCHACPPRR